MKRRSFFATVIAALTFPYRRIRNYYVKPRIVRLPFRFDRNAPPRVLITQEAFDDLKLSMDLKDQNGRVVGTMSSKNAGVFPTNET